MPLTPNGFWRKGWGRIYVPGPAGVQAVLDAIKAVDESELAYMPKDFITVWSGGEEPRPPLIYGHKFEIDMVAITEYCWTRGIRIWCVSQRNEENLVV